MFLLSGIWGRLAWCSYTGGGGGEIGMVPHTLMCVWGEIGMVLMLLITFFYECHNQGWIEIITCKL